MLALVLALAAATGTAPGVEAAAPAPEPAPAVSLSLPAPPPAPLPPARDPGPFGRYELAGALGGVALADLLVGLGGYATLQLFAQDAIDPTAANFRRTAYAFGAAALLLPPLSAALVGRWASPARGHFWRAFLVGLAGQLAAGAIGMAMAPHYWVALPAQLVTVTFGTSLGLHLGKPSRRAAPRAADPPARPEPPVRTALAPVTCPVG